MKVRLASITYDSVVDGPGMRTVVWFQGCSHRCHNCHNEQLQDFNGGYEMTSEELVDALSDSNRITFSGGDPLFQIEALDELLGKLGDKDIWIYTGFELDKVQEMFSKTINIKDKKLVVKCGPFILEQLDYSIRFRGSSNQRIYTYAGGEFTDVSDKIDEGESIWTN